MRMTAEASGTQQRMRMVDRLVLEGFFFRQRQSSVEEILLCAPRYLEIRHRKS